MSKDRVVAICCADIHLCHNPPVARSNEPDWYYAMSRTLGQLGKISKKYDAPIVCAGDIFDRWNSSPELINFAILQLPFMYSIPGQHDLPSHNIEDIRKSAYWTLLQTETISHIDLPTMVEKNLFLWPFQWGEDIAPLDKSHDSDRMHVAVAHKYVWKPGYGFEGAPEENRVKAIISKLKGYDVAVFGDNHQGFRNHQIFNCGSLMRRTIAQRDYEPQVGLLHQSGHISTVKLDCSKDKMLNLESALEAVEKVIDMTDFLTELTGLGKTAIDFVQAVKQFLEQNNLGKRTRRLIEEVIETTRKP